MGRFKAETTQPAAPKKPALGSVPFGAFGHSGGVLMETAPGQEQGTLVIRVGGRYDFIFKNGEPLAYGTVEGLQSFLYQPAVAPKLVSRLILPGRIH